MTFFDRKEDKKWANKIGVDAVEQLLTPKVVLGSLLAGRGASRRTCINQLLYVGGAEADRILHERPGISFAMCGCRPASVSPAVSSRTRLSPKRPRT